MNRDELLEECFGRSDFRQGDLVVEESEGSDVVSHLDVYFRRIIVRPPTPLGPFVSDASTMFLVAAIAQVCTDPARRGEGFASGLIRRAHEEAAKRQSIYYAALFSAYDDFYGRFGYFRPAGARHEMLRVCELKDESWPDGVVLTNGEW